MGGFIVNIERIRPLFGFPRQAAAPPGRWLAAAAFESEGFCLQPYLLHPDEDWSNIHSLLPILIQRLFQTTYHGEFTMVESSTYSQGQAKQGADWSWLLKILIQPRKTLAKILRAEQGVWLPALVGLSVAALLLVLANGIVRQRIGVGNPAQLPEYFQYYTPEQQQQFMQALQATSGAAFLFGLPALTGLAGVWLRWLVVGSLVYLILTAVGSGVKSGTALNLVAWASVPLALRDLVRAAAVLSTSRLIQAPGLSGFVPAGVGSGSLFLSALLTLLDLYWVWHVVLIVLGGNAAGKASAGKTTAGLTLVMIFILLAQALIGFGLLSLGSKITAVQVFF